MIFLNEYDESVYSRINIINNAKKELLISYFIFEDDEIGLMFMDILVKKKEQNPDIDIKLLLDASGNGVDRELTYFLESKGIEVREFHPLPKLSVPTSKISIKKFIAAIQNFNMRMHDKLIIADQVAFITGGRNIENSYYGLDKRNFYDRDLYFYSGQLTSHVRDYFLNLWRSKYVEKISYFTKLKSKNNLVKSKNKILSGNVLREKYNDYNLKITSTYLPLTEGLYFEKAFFLSSYDPDNSNFNPEHLSTSLYNFMLKVNNEAIIETPYLLPTKNLYKLLKYLSDQKIKVEFVTNSICSTDVMPIAAAYDNQKEKFNQLDVELYEFQGPNYLHTKSAVIDDKFALIGSYNMDPRSAYINTELVFIIAAELKKIIDRDKGKSVKVENNSMNTYGGYYDCMKSGADMRTYLLFKILTNYKILYNQF